MFCPRALYPGTPHTDTPPLGLKGAMFPIGAQSSGTTLAGVVGLRVVSGPIP